MKDKNRQEWILLIHLLPPKPTNLRVRTWRKLQAFGAVAIKNSVYVLPFNEKTNEDFQWLKQEIESAGGEANLFRADSIEGATDQEIIAQFRKLRDEDYSRLISEFEGLCGAVRQQQRTDSLPGTKLVQYEADLTRLRQELEQIKSTDFFAAPNGTKAQAAFEKCQRELQSIKSKTESPSTDQNASAKLSVADYQSRRWVTRRDPHIDRLACAWLIKRFIDKRPRFQFVIEGESVENSVGYDMANADFTHRGEDCSFETIMKSFGLETDRALVEIAEIVHDVDLKDSKFNRLEANGVKAVVSGLAEIHRDDGERVKQCLLIFDGLYELFRNGSGNLTTENNPAKKKQGGKRNAGGK